MDQPLILDRYRPLEDLASGGFGDVVLAFDTRIQRRVAIKRLPLPRSRTGKVTTSAGLAEARTAALLNHPNIVTVLEWDTDSDEAFIIMEYVDGPTLGDLLDENGSLDTDVAAAVLEGVSSALEFAHENGVLHLDIKPENILITRDGRVKVADFGVAALSTASGHGPAYGGTLGYMPLEQLRGEELDESTDVWALAAVMYETLTDANPFASDTIEGAIFKAEVVDAPSPSEFEPGIDPAIDDIMLAALATYRLDRYTNVADFSHRLLLHLGDPASGREELAQLAEEFSGEPASGPVSWDRIGLWDRLAPLAGLARRAGAGAAAAWLVWAGLGAFPVQTTATVGAATLAAVAGILAPGLGAVIGLGVLIAGLVAKGFYLFAAVFAIAGGLIWWFEGRHDGAFAGALLVPLLGVIKLSASGPLLLGYESRPLKAGILAGYAGALTMLASAASGASAPYLDVNWAWFVDPLHARVTAGSVRYLLSTPSPLAVVAAWMLAGVVMSLACSWASRTAAVLGAALAMGALWAGYLMADLIGSALNGSATWTGEPLLVHVMASSILVIVVIAAGAPVRAEEP